MPKAKPSNATKAKSYQQSHPEDFILKEDKLFCKWCKVFVSCDKNFNVNSHLSGKKHKSYSRLHDQPLLNVDAEKSGTSFSLLVTDAFLSADIPLYKLNNSKIRKLFESIGHPLPSESTCRQKVPDVALIMLTKTQDLVKDQQIFIQYDEAEISNSKFTNILIGKIDQPDKSYLIDTIFLNTNIDSSIVVRHIDDLLKKIGIQRENFVLLISDAAKYMVTAGKTLKILFPNLFHVTCIAHFLHNCALRIHKKHFPKIDNLISKVKAATIKNKTRQRLFSHIASNSSCHKMGFLDESSFLL